MPYGIKQTPPWLLEPGFFHFLGVIIIITALLSKICSLFLSRPTDKTSHFARFLESCESCERFLQEKFQKS
jgi:hypothetical protein